MLSLLHFRSVLTAASYSSARIIEDPGNFLRLVNERLRATSIPFWSFLKTELPLLPQNVEIEHLIKLGRFDDARGRIRKLSLRDKFLAVGLTLAITRMESRLHLEIVPAGEYVKRNSLRVLMHVNSATPFTYSGYTVRTNGLVGALSSHLEQVHQVTRLGYPAIIGKLPQPKVPDGLLIQIPWVFPYLERHRFRTATRTLYKLCDRYNPSVLHTTTDFSNAHVVSHVAQKLKIPWVYEIRGEPYNTWLSRFGLEESRSAESSHYYRLSKAKELEAAQAASGVVVLSQLARNYLISEGIDPEKVCVVPNGVDDSFHPDALQATELLDEYGLRGRTILGVISALVGYEGVDTLIMALNYLDEEVHLVVVGEGQARPHLERLCNQQGLGDRVTFVGRRSPVEMPAWYSLIDMLVVPRSNVEVCRNVTPIKPLQAQAVGTPVIASDLPALREVTGGFAKFFTPEDPRALATAVKEVLVDPSAWTAPSNWVAERRWSSLVEPLVDLYRKLLVDDGKGNG